jgi:hypothetical protein
MLMNARLIYEPHWLEHGDHCWLARWAAGRHVGGEWDGEDYPGGEALVATGVLPYADERPRLEARAALAVAHAFGGAVGPFRAGGVEIDGNGVAWWRDRGTADASLQEH